MEECQVCPPGKKCKRARGRQVTAGTSHSLLVDLPHDPIDSILTRLVIPISQRVRTAIQVFRSSQAATRPSDGQRRGGSVDGDECTGRQTQCGLLSAFVREEIGLGGADIAVVLFGGVVVGIWEEDGDHEGQDDWVGGRE